MKIYTKTGDKGQTGIFKGRLSKAELLPEALGNIDEQNSIIGVCRERVEGEEVLAEELKRIQANLLTIGSGLAGSGKKIKPTETARLERKIDKWTAELPKLANFIYPGGRGGAAELQLARAMARRAERAVVRVKENGGEVSGRTSKYLNRLSDGLFVMARWRNFKLGVKDEVWKAEKEE